MKFLFIASVFEKGTVENVGKCSSKGFMDAEVVRMRVHLLTLIRTR